MTMRIILLFTMLLLAGCEPLDCCYIDSARVHTKEHDKHRIYENSHLPNHPLTLDEIIDYAIVHNLDLRVQAVQYRVEQEKVTSESLKTLPSFTFNGDHSWRDQSTAAFSIDSDTGTVTSTIDPATGQVLPPAPSISRSQRTNTFDFTGAYNLVDFGVSYVRARQQENRALSSCFQYERQKQNIVLDVFRAYWKGIAALHGLARSEAIRAKSLEFERSIKQIMDGGNLPRLPALATQKQLSIIRTRFSEYKKNYLDAKAELAALMGASPDIDFELAPIEISRVDLEIDPAEVLEEIAFIHRPELYAADAEHRIFREEVRAKLIQMFPNISVFLGEYQDADPFLVNHYWLLSGARAAWNLLSLPQRWYDRKSSQMQVAQSQESRIALTLGVMTQVHLARIAYNNNHRIFRELDHIFDLNQQSLFIAAMQHNLGAIDGIDFINFEADNLESEVNAISAYGDMQVAIELVNNSIGIPLYYNRIPKRASEKGALIVQLVQ